LDGADAIVENANRLENMIAGSAQQSESYKEGASAVAEEELQVRACLLQMTGLTCIDGASEDRPKEIFDEHVAAIKKRLVQAGVFRELEETSSGRTGSSADHAASSGSGSGERNEPRSEIRDVRDLDQAIVRPGLRMADIRRASQRQERKLIYTTRVGG
jgi:hypothetical protein